MTGILLLSFLFFSKVEDITAAKILAVFPTPSISHQVVFRPLIRELVKRGHDVTVITTDPAYPPGQTPKNLTEIDVHDLSYKLWREELLTKTVENNNDVSRQMNIILKIILKVTLAQMQTKEVQDIINNKKEKFDLLLLEACVQSALIYSHFIKVPVIQISSFSGMSFNYKTVGASTHPFLYPQITHQRLYNLTYFEKLRQLYNYWSMENVVWEIEQESDRRLKSIFGNDIPSLKELVDNVQMLFLNANPIWIDNLPVPPNVVYIDGIHLPPQKELPKDLQFFLDSSKNGVIYFSLGTNVKPSTFPSSVIQMFMKVFSQLPFHVLWKWDSDVLPGLSDNVKVMQWLPQSDLLRHPNVKLFITQGGLQSTDEAINAGVPLIGIPLLADQWFNVEKYVRHQIGIQLDIASLTEDQFKTAIETVMSDKRFCENIIRLRTIMADQPQPPLERAVWWTEHLIRHGGAKHLRAAGANISWAQYLEHELILILTLILLFAFIIILISLYVIWKFIRRTLKPKSKQKLT